MASLKMVNPNPIESTSENFPYIILILKVIHKAMDDLHLLDNPNQHKTWKPCYQRAEKLENEKNVKDAQKFMSSKTLEWYLIISGLRKYANPSDIRRLSKVYQKQNYGSQIESLINEG